MLISLAFSSIIWTLLVKTPLRELCHIECSHFTRVSLTWVSFLNLWGIGLMIGSGFSKNLKSALVTGPSNIFLWGGDLSLFNLFFRAYLFIGWDLPLSLPPSCRNSEVSCLTFSGGHLIKTKSITWQAGMICLGLRFMGVGVSKTCTGSVFPFVSKISGGFFIPMVCGHRSFS